VALVPGAAWAALAEPPAVGPVPVDFLLFGLVLAGVAIFHHHTLRVAVSGLAVIAAWKVLFSPFATGPGLEGLGAHLLHEWVLIANLLLLLMGFALLSRHFEDSRVPAWLPRLLPDDWKGAFVLLVIIFVLSSFLDNIAAALIAARSRRSCSGARCTSATSPRSSPRRTPAGRAASSATRRRR
jgi:biotin transporter BioY